MLLISNLKPILCERCQRVIENTQDATLFYCHARYWCDKCDNPGYRRDKIKGEQPPPYRFYHFDFALQCASEKCSSNTEASAIYQARKYLVTIMFRIIELGEREKSSLSIPGSSAAWIHQTLAERCLQEVGTLEDADRFFIHLLINPKQEISNLFGSSAKFEMTTPPAQLYPIVIEHLVDYILAVIESYMATIAAFYLKIGKARAQYDYQQFFQSLIAKPKNFFSSINTQLASLHLDMIALQEQKLVSDEAFEISNTKPSKGAQGVLGSDYMMMLRKSG